MQASRSLRSLDVADATPQPQALDAMIPQSMNDWLNDAKSSLADACEIMERGDIPSQNLYMLAPLVYSDRFNTKNEALIQEISEANDEQVAQDWSIDEKSKFQFKFHYVSSYLFCFVVAGKIEEMKYDKIMHFICSKMELFTSDYSPE